MNLKNIGIGVVVVLALLFGYLYFTSASSPFGSANVTGPIYYQTVGFQQGAAFGTRNQSYFSNTGALTIGSTGTAVNRVNTGTCYILPYATTIVASSSASVDCQGTAKIGTTNTGKATALVGVVAGDTVIASLSSTTIGSAFGGIDIIQAVASTTNGYLTFVVRNMTGTTFTWPVNSTASGTASYIVTH